MLRCGPGSSVAPPTAGDGKHVWFEDQAQENGLTFVHESGFDGTCLFPEIIGGGVAMLDMDDDGDLDLYFVQSGSLHESPPESVNRLYRNIGDGRFEDATIGSGADDAGYGMGVATGDYDNDGDLDLYVTNFGPNVLLRNEGDGTFTDVTTDAGVGDEGWGTSAAFVDVDADGHLDLYVANYVNWYRESEKSCRSAAGQITYCDPNSYEAPAQDVLYRNNRDGSFTDESAAAGVRSNFGNGLGVVCADFDLDGLVDIFVANDGMPNQLWKNAGEGTFQDVARVTGCAVDRHGTPKAGMGACAADVDDDGDHDLLVVNLRAESDSFFRNEGSYFVDDTATVGLGSVTLPYIGFGVGLVDFNNDGRLDLYEANGRVALASALEVYSDDPYAEPNVLLQGTPQGAFELLSPLGGTAEVLAATSRGAAFGDLDNDGGIDIVVVNRDDRPYLLRNVARDRGHWILFEVVNRTGGDAIGATLTLHVGDRRITRVVRTAFSYCAANDPRVHVGLGDVDRVEDVTVRWTDGTTERFGNFDADQIVSLVRDDGDIGSP